MPNPEKAGAVAELTERFTNASAAVITEYRGLSVKQVTQLRRSLGRETTYAIVKNTLTKRAAADAGVPIDDAILTGPTAIAFVHGDPVVAAKGLRDFARTNPMLVIKGGVLDGKALSAAEVARIADLESREVLLAKLAGALKALPTRAAGLFQAPLSQMARLAKALEEKKPASGEDAAPSTEAASVADTEASTPDTVAEAVDAPAIDVAASADTVDTADTADTVDTAPDQAAEAAPETPAEPAE